MWTNQPQAPCDTHLQARLRQQLAHWLQSGRGSHPMALERDRLVARFLKYRIESRLIPLRDMQGRAAGTLARSWIGTPDGRSLDGQTLRLILRHDAAAQRALQALWQQLHACNYFLLAERQGPLHLPLQPGEQALEATTTLQQLGLSARHVAVVIEPQCEPAASFQRQGLHVGISLARETWGSELPQDLHAGFVHLQPQRWAAQQLNSLQRWAQQHAARIIRHGALLCA
ncbi:MULTISPECIES: hypothetical protein [unclassified Paludibacterium]|uniref:hypothetical protein n=1 Tax=unclassified Paludibacterium TaxID=2618429 RepID=UPI001C041EA3|nr:hypothetical protein [Paludibacterium sp. B53371]BEV71064.1 hypothetical protein THUN1379_05460 [Paludibacterium sp. THUN1379]